jgi:hypothetical protein
MACWLPPGTTLTCLRTRRAHGAAGSGVVSTYVTTTWLRPPAFSIVTATVPAASFGVWRAAPP